MVNNISITSTTAYSDAIIKIREDALRIKKFGINRPMTVQVPDNLVRLIHRYPNFNATLEDVKEGISSSLHGIVNIDEWNCGVDDEGVSFIHFKIFPERLVEY